VSLESGDGGELSNVSRTVQVICRYFSSRFNISMSVFPNIAISVRF